MADCPVGVNSFGVMKSLMRFLVSVLKLSQSFVASRNSIVPSPGTGSVLINWAGISLRTPNNAYTLYVAAWSIVISPRATAASIKSYEFGGEVRVGVGVRVNIGVAVAVGVFVGVFVGVLVGVFVTVGVAVGVSVGVLVAVGVGVQVDVGGGVGVGPVTMNIEE
jgi:hypothetical protein